MPVGGGESPPKRDEGGLSDLYWPDLTRWAVGTEQLYQIDMKNNRQKDQSTRNFLSGTCWYQSYRQETTRTYLNSCVVY